MPNKDIEADDTLAIEGGIRINYLVVATRRSASVR